MLGSRRSARPSTRELTISAILGSVNLPTWFGLLVAGTYAALLASFCGVIAARLPVRVGDQLANRTDGSAEDDPARTVGDDRADDTANGPADELASAPSDEPGSGWTTRPWAEAMSGRSRCDTCDAPIELWRNIPVVSWLIQRGKCAKCGAHIPVETVVIEVLVPALVVATFAVAGWTWTAAGTCWLILIGAIVVQIDARTMMIPSKVLAVGWVGTIVTAVLAVVFAEGPERWPIASSAALGAVFGGLLMFALWWLTGGVGFGDVRLAWWIGAQIGLVVAAALPFELAGYRWAMTVMGGGIALMVAATIGLAWGLARGLRRGQAMPFGPFLIAGAVAVCVAAPAVLSVA